MKTIFYQVLLFAALGTQVSHPLTTTETLQLTAKVAAQCQAYLKSLQKELDLCVEKQQSECSSEKEKLEKYNNDCQKAYEIQRKFSAQLQNYLNKQDKS